MPVSGKHSFPIGNLKAMCFPASPVPGVCPVVPSRSVATSRRAQGHPLHRCYFRHGKRAESSREWQILGAGGWQAALAQTASPKPPGRSAVNPPRHSREADPMSRRAFPDKHSREKLPNSSSFTKPFLSPHPTTLLSKICGGGPEWLALQRALHRPTSLLDGKKKHY